MRRLSPAAGSRAVDRKASAGSRKARRTTPASRKTEAAAASAFVNPAYAWLIATIDEAASGLRAPAISDRAAHDVRKALKKSRAALRLLRGGSDEASYRAENAVLRDVGRELAPLRDAKVLVEALGELRDRDSKALRHAKLGSVHAALGADLARARRRVRAAHAKLKQRGRRLAAHREGFLSGEFREASLAAPAPGLRRLYRKGRKAMVEAARTATPEVLHEWRKQVKYLLNAVDGVHDALRSGAEKISRRAHRLADRLGDDHDLAVLSEKLARSPYAPTGSKTARRLRSVIARRRRKLQKRAFDLGRKLYAKKPKKFAARLMKRSALGRNSNR